MRCDQLEELSPSHQNLEKKKGNSNYIHIQQIYKLITPFPFNFRSVSRPGSKQRYSPPPLEERRKEQMGANERNTKIKEKEREREGKQEPKNLEGLVEEREDKRRTEREMERN